MLARFLGHEETPEELRTALATADPGSVGRWQKALDAEGLADVEREAGALLSVLGYGSPA